MNAGIAHMRGWPGVGDSLTGDRNVSKGIAYLTAAAKQAHILKTVYSDFLISKYTGTHSQKYSL